MRLEAQTKGSGAVLVTFRGQNSTAVVNVMKQAEYDVTLTRAMTHRSKLNSMAKRSNWEQQFQPNQMRKIAVLVVRQRATP